MPVSPPEHITEIALRPGRKPMCDIPELPGKVLRRLNVANSAGDLSLSPWRFVATAEEHLAWLREAGMAIPEATFYMHRKTRAQPFNTGYERIKRRRLSRPAGPEHPPIEELYIVADAIDCQTTENNNFEWLSEPRVKPHAAQTADTLSNYFDWASSQQFFLDDITPPRQYIFGINVCNPGVGERLFMVDIEPSLGQARSTSPLYLTAWQRSLEDVQRWQFIKHLNS